MDMGDCAGKAVFKFALNYLYQYCIRKPEMYKARGQRERSCFLMRSERGFEPVILKMLLQQIKPSHIRIRYKKTAFHVLQKFYRE